MKYQVPDDSPVYAGESPACAVNLNNDHIRKVNISKMMADGYMTLEQSKALIEKKIYELLVRHGGKRVYDDDDKILA